MSGDISRLIVKSIGQLRLATANCVHRHLQSLGHDFSFSQVNYGISRLIQGKEIDCLQLSLGIPKRNIYYLKNQREIADRIVLNLKQEIISVLEKQLFGYQAQVIRSLPTEHSYGVKHSVFRHIFAMGEIEGICIQVKNRFSWVYFTPRRKPMIREWLEKTLSILSKQKCISVFDLSIALSVDDQTAWFLAKHLVYKGDLNYVYCSEIENQDNWKKKVVIYFPGYRSRARLYAHFLKMQSCVESLGLDQNLADTAFQFLLGCQSLEKVRGRSLNELAAGCLYLAGKIHRRPVLPEQIATATGTNKNAVVEASKFLAEVLNVPTESLVFHPRDYVGSFVSKLEIAEKEKNLLEQKALEIVNSLPQSAFAGHSRATIAGAAIYLAANELKIYLTQSEVGWAAGITEVSIRNVKSQILKTLERRGC